MSDSSPAVPPRSLTRQVGSLARLMVVTVGATALVSGLVLALLFLVLVPQTDRYFHGARGVRLAHLAMVDQETALRGFLASGGRAQFLSPYERGSRDLPVRNADVREAFAGEPELLALQAKVEARQAAWSDGWAEQALRGVPAGTTEADFVRLDKALFDDYRAAEAAVERRADALREDSAQRQTRLLVLGLALEVLLAVGVAAIVARQFLRLRAEVVEPVEGLTATISRLRDGDLAARRAARRARARAGAGRRARPGRGGDRRHVVLPRHHVARDPHPDERRHRDDRPAPRHRPDARAARLRRDRPHQR